MTLTIRLKRRWITSILRVAAKDQPRLPWQRGTRSLSRTSGRPEARSRPPAVRA